MQGLGSGLEGSCVDDGEQGAQVDVHQLSLCISSFGVGLMAGVVPTVPGVIASLVAGLLFGLSLIVAIGAQNAFVLRVGLTRHGIGAVVAVCAGSDLVLIAAGVAGLGALVQAVPGGLVVARVAGAAFLIGYAVVAIRRAWRPGPLDPDGSAAADDDGGPARRSGPDCAVTSGNSAEGEGSADGAGGVDGEDGTDEGSSLDGDNRENSDDRENCVGGADGADSTDRGAAGASTTPRTWSAIRTAPSAEPRRTGATVLTVLALTWLNPHVYLDTVILLGSVAATHGATRWWFGAGAMLGSVLWFTALGYGARLLRPVFARPAAWRVLDGLIAAVTVLIAVGLIAGIGG